MKAKPIAYVMFKAPVTKASTTAREVVKTETAEAIDN